MRVQQGGDQDKCQQQSSRGDNNSGSSLISAVTTYFFGTESNDEADGCSGKAASDAIIVATSNKDESDCSCAASPTKLEKRGGRSESLITTTSIIPLLSSTTDDSVDAPITTLTGRSRSMSPTAYCSSTTFSNNYRTYTGIGEDSLADGWLGCQNGLASTRSDSPIYQPYFETSDFTEQTWLNVLQETETIHYCGAGAAIITAAIVVHPLVLIGAAAVGAVGVTAAAWAVGLFHEIEKGYQIWSNEVFGTLFWEDATTVNISTELAASPAIVTPSLGSRKIIPKDKMRLRRAFQEATEDKTNDVKDDRGDLQQQETLEEAANRVMRVNSAPVRKPLLRIRSLPVGRFMQHTPPPLVLLPPRHPKATQHPTTLPPSTLTTQQLLDSHYPSLEIRVVNEVELHGLNAFEFFQVFFSDDAPYSMKDFQQTRGDVDIVYGCWNEVTNVQDLSSFKKVEPGLLPLPPDSTQERTLTFNTLTKSYFGPTYAKATKTQRATRLNKHLLIIENQTQLSDVPFSDRFKILERWIIEAVKSADSGNGGGGGRGGGLYTCKLTVHAEVVMVSSCRFESQIRKKASETFTDLTTEWCKLATKALEATKEQKRKRVRNEQKFDDDRNVSSAVVSDDSRQQEVSKKSCEAESELFAKHQQKFQELEDLIANCEDNIEVSHSIEAGVRSAFAQVVELPGTPSSAFLKLSDGTVVEVATGAEASSPTSILSRKKSPRLLRKLSFRVSRSKLR